MISELIDQINQTTMKKIITKRRKESSDSFAFFKKVALEAFNFLITEHQFTLVSTEEHLPECQLKFWNETTGINISHELGGASWVTLSKLARKDGKIFESKSYGLSALIAYQCSKKRNLLAWKYKYGQASDEELENYIRAQAALLKECAQDILAGDFSVFPALKKVAADIRRKRNKELFGTYSGELPRFSTRPTLAELFADAKAIDPTLEKLFNGKLNQDKTNFRIYQAYWDYGYSISELAAFLKLSEQMIEQTLDEQDDYA